MAHRFLFPRGDKYDTQAILDFALGGWEEVPAKRKNDLRMRNFF